MDFDFNVETIGAIFGAVFAGVLTGLAIRRGEIKSAQGLIDHYASEYRRVSYNLYKERSLTDGLTQELAVQAKLV